MLILTREIGETIDVSEDIKVTVLGVSGNKVRISVEAPKDVSARMKEVQTEETKSRTQTQ